MAGTNIFYRTPSQRGFRVASITGSSCTLDQFCNFIAQSEGIDLDEFILGYGTKIIRPNSCNPQSIRLQNNSHVDIIIPILGGKGGFGSLLRAIGAQIEKTTNRDACRDLSGRRLRDIKKEEELIKLLALQEKLKEEQKRRKKEKLEKLKKKTRDSEASTSIQELINMFDDHAFSKRRLEIGDIIDAAVKKGIINSKRSNTDGETDVRVKKRTRVVESVDGTNEAEVPIAESKEQTTQSNESTDQPKISSSHERKIQTKRKDLWLGLEEDDEDN